MIKPARRWCLARSAQWLLVAAGLFLGACRTVPAPQALPPPAPPPPPVVPERIEHYRIDADHSQVLILVYRDGAMARLGHNHVLSVHQLSGEVVMPADSTQASFELEFPVAAMTVDEPALRAQLGDEFNAPVDAASIDGTRQHMLGEKLLDAAHFPKIRLQSESLRADAEHWLVTLNITVRHHDSTVEVPMALTSTPEQLSASGEFDLSHAQLGLTPYSVGMGALRVAETIHIRYRLIAQRAQASGSGSDTP